MTKIKIVYRPFKILPWYRQLVLKIPGNWNDLSENQFILAPDFINGRINNLKFISSFFNLSDKITSQIDKDLLLTIIQSLSWIKEWKKATNYIDHFIIKRIFIFESSPKHLKNIKFHAFAMADNYYKNIFRGKIEDIYKLILCFYYDEDKFQPEHIDLAPLILVDEDFKILDAILLNYTLICNWLSKQYPNSFAAYSQIKELDSSLGWTSLCNSKNFSLEKAFAYLEVLTRYFFENGKCMDDNLTILLKTNRN
jgi:hypothetical protein